MQTGQLPLAHRTPERTRRPAIGVLVHSARVVMVIALLMFIPSVDLPVEATRSAVPELERIQQILPAVVSVDDSQNGTGLWRLFDETGKLLGTLARTLPAAEKIVGYRGPTEASILLDPEMRIVSVQLVHSADTEEHVDAVVADKSFFKQFQGWPWGGPKHSRAIDGVSGATLTSLALAEGVLKRIGGNRPSLLFPNSVSPDEVRQWFDTASMVDDAETVTIIQDRDGKPLGRVLRTGPFSDDITGYRGPTELLMKLGDHDRVEAIQVRSSYETEPFLGYIREEGGFLAIFEQQTLEELAAFDPAGAGVEGVSGATMTSMAVADTIVAAASVAQSKIESESNPPADSFRLLGIRFSVADIATILLLTLAAIASRTHRFRNPRFRTAWLVLVVTVIGFWTGNLISLALIAGWSAAGAAWKLAPALAALVALALAAPPLAGRNPYCNHLCPHGAMQQLIRPSRRSVRRIRPSRRLSTWLTRIPAATLAAAYLALIAIPELDLSSWEPFHAYLIQIAPIGAIAIAIASLILASLIPMGYCRFGCPTGSLLDYLRRSATSDQFRSGDAVVVALLFVVLLIRA